MKARGVVRVTPADTGSRVTIRSLVRDPRDGPSMTDTVGVLESWTDGVLRIRKRSGEVVALDERTLVAGRTIPAAFPHSAQEKE